MKKWWRHAETFPKLVTVMEMFLYGATSFLLYEKDELMGDNVKI